MYTAAVIFRNINCVGKYFPGVHCRVSDLIIIRRSADVLYEPYFWKSCSNVISDFLTGLGGFIFCGDKDGFPQPRPFSPGGEGWCEELYEFFGLYIFAVFIFCCYNNFIPTCFQSYISNFKSEISRCGVCSVNHFLAQCPFYHLIFIRISIIRKAARVFFFAHYEYIRCLPVTLSENPLRFLQFVHGKIYGCLFKQPVSIRAAYADIFYAVCR